MHALVPALLLAVPPQQAQVEGELLGAIVGCTGGYTGTEVVGSIPYTAGGLGDQHQEDQQDNCPRNSDRRCHDSDGSDV